MPKRKKSQGTKAKKPQRSEVERVLREDFKLEVNGLYAWLRERKSLRSRLGATWSPHKPAAVHAAKCGGGSLQCQVCAVWAVLVECWSVAGQLHHAMATTVEKLAALRGTVQAATAELFARDGIYPPALAELRARPGGIPREAEELIHAPRRIVLAARLLKEEATVLEHAIGRSLEPAVSAKVHEAGRDLLIAKVCFDLSRAGFSYPDIGALLSEVRTPAEALREAQERLGPGATKAMLDTQVKAAIAGDRRRASDRINRRVKRYNTLLRERV